MRAGLAISTDSADRHAYHRGSSKPSDPRRHESLEEGARDGSIPRRGHPAGHQGPARPRLRAGAVPHDGRVQQLRDQLLDHLDPHRRGHPVQPRPDAGGTGRGRHRLAARDRLHADGRGRDGRDRVRLSDGRGPVLLGQPTPQQGLGLVDRLAEPRRPGLDRRRDQLLGGVLPLRDDPESPLRGRPERRDGRGPQPGTSRSSH